MKLPRTALYFVIGLSGASIFAQAAHESIPVLTVCEALSDLKTYNGKEVVIVGRSAWTFEGTFLSENCETDGHIAIQGNRWLSMIFLAGEGRPSGRQTGFRFDEELLRQKLAEVRQTTRLTSEPKPTSKSNLFSDRWVAILGRLVSPPMLLPHRPPGDSQTKNVPGNGFGANGSVPAKVIQLEIYDLSERQ